MEDYIQGLEDMFLTIKEITKMSREERAKWYGASRLDVIMERFNFIQFQQIADAVKKNKVED